MEMAVANMRAQTFDSMRASPGMNQGGISAAMAYVAVLTLSGRQLLRNLPIAQPTRDKPQHGYFALCERLRCWGMLRRPHERTQHFPCNLGMQGRLTAMHLPNGAHEIFWPTILQQIS